MPRFSKTSFNRLKTCDIRLVKLFSETVKHFDCSVLEGTRGAVVQMGYYHSTPRKTRLVFPFSKHNPGSIDIPAISNILSCGPTLEAIKDSIVHATTRQLIKIDKLDPLEKSLAVDVIPYPVDWRFEKDLWQAYSDDDISAIKAITHNIQRWFKFIGFVEGIALKIGVKIRSGADWDGDNIMSDQRFDDLPHFELED